MAGFAGLEAASHLRPVALIVEGALATRLLEAPGADPLKPKRSTSNGNMQRLARHN